MLCLLLEQSRKAQVHQPLQLCKTRSLLPEEDNSRNYVSKRLAHAEAAEELLQRASTSGNNTTEGGTTNGAVRLDGKAFRRALGKNGKYIRTPKNDPASLALMDEHGVGYSTTGLVAQMRANGNRWQHKDISVKLAQVRSRDACHEVLHQICIVIHSQYKFCRLCSWACSGLPGSKCEHPACNERHLSLLHVSALLPFPLSLLEDGLLCARPLGTAGEFSALWRWRMRRESNTLGKSFTSPMVRSLQDMQYSGESLLTE